jgi:hypothetical protein
MGLWVTNFSCSYSHEKTAHNANRRRLLPGDDDVAQDAVAQRAEQRLALDRLVPRLDAQCA